MRWPLRNQIMLPMLGVMLGALVGVSVLNAYLSGHRAKQHIERQLQEVTRTLSESTFPLTDAVLRQMRGLSGAEFVVVDDFARVIASTVAVEGVPLQARPQQAEELILDEPIGVGDRRYFYAVVRLRRHNKGEQTVRLHILYPEQSFRAAWRQAVYPPLAIGAVTLLFVVAFAVAIASRVARPLLGLQRQVGQIAEGDFRRMEVPRRNDEVGDLCESINRMARLLSRYEDEVRHSERLRTLAQLGNGIAHQMRNSATGCRLAIQLHQRECPPESTCDCLDVADRQITLMEKQLKRFLSLGKPNMRPTSVVDLAMLVEDTLPLLQPYARHVGVALQWSYPIASFTTKGDSDALEQMIINLLLNAIEAAASCRDGNSLPRIEQASVTVQLDQRDEGRIVLEVIDSGSGPSGSVRANVFEPFVTDKPDGTGLGLSVAREIAEQHDGAIRWCRLGNTTSFTVELPLASVEIPCVEITRG